MLTNTKYLVYISLLKIQQYVQYFLTDTIYKMFICYQLIPVRVLKTCIK